MIVLVITGTLVTHEEEFWPIAARIRDGPRHPVFPVQSALRMVPSIFMPRFLLVHTPEVPPRIFHPYANKNVSRDASHVTTPLQVSCNRRAPDRAGVHYFVSGRHTREHILAKARNDRVVSFGKL